MLHYYSTETYEPAPKGITCRNISGIIERKSCSSAEECLENVRLGCDNNPMCFGVEWNEKNRSDEIRICRGTQMQKAMEDENNQWITQLKSLKRNKIMDIFLEFIYNLILLFLKFDNIS